LSDHRKIFCRLSDHRKIFCGLPVVFPYGSRIFTFQIWGHFQNKNCN
jgi:hypothetical protein